MTPRKIKVVFGCYHGFGWSKVQHENFVIQAIEAGQNDLFETSHSGLGWLGLPPSRWPKKLEFEDADVLVVRTGYAQSVKKLLSTSGNKKIIVVAHDADLARSNTLDKNKQLLWQVLTAVRRRK